MILKLTSLLVIFHVIYASEQYSFWLKEDSELRFHIITTVITPYVELCWDKCVWIMNCFSINVRKTRFGTVECDLNNSSQKAIPANFKKRTGSLYYHMKSTQPCRVYPCKTKNALGDGWFRYNKKALKLFTENKTWTDARAHCLSLGGDLLSIRTQYESDFYHEVTKLTPTHTGLHEPWIGYNAVNSSIKYKWSDGTKSEFTRLLSGWDISAQKCVALKNGREWLPIICEEEREYFCERPFN